MDIQIASGSDELAANAADFIIASARNAIAARGRFAIALAGGHTPKATYTLLAQPDRIGQIEWDKVFVFFGDERFVETGSPDSNYGMARSALLSHVPLKEDQIFPMPHGPIMDEDAAAEEYQRVLADFFGVPPAGAPPQLDLILLGLGDDGHTASLFPGARTLTINDAWVAASPPGTLPPPVDRLTLTFPALNAARQVAFLVSGSAKADIVATLLDGHAVRDAHPAIGVQPSDGAVTWMLDRDSAAHLKR